MAKTYCKCVNTHRGAEMHINTRQMASHSCNDRRRSHPLLGDILHCAMHMLWRGMCYVLLQVLYLLLPERWWRKIRSQAHEQRTDTHISCIRRES
jgi:hypothetical protein